MSDAVPSPSSPGGAMRLPLPPGAAAQRQHYVGTSTVPSDGDTDGERTSTEPKKRRFHPLRGLRKIFRRKTRSVEPPRVHEAQEQAHAKVQIEYIENEPPKRSSGLTVSVSHDSVFTVEAADRSDSDIDDMGQSISELSGSRLSRTKDDISKSYSTCSDGSFISTTSSIEDVLNVTTQSKLSLERKSHRTLESPNAGWETGVGSTALNHSAARHKMAVKPRRTHGPPRRRKKTQMTSLSLPATLEVNEEIRRSSQHIGMPQILPLDYAVPMYTQLKSASLPPGLAPGALGLSGDAPTSAPLTNQVIRSSSSAMAYSRSTELLKHSKGMDRMQHFGSVGEEGENEDRTETKRKEESFFGRLLSRRSGKKKLEKTEIVDIPTSSISKEISSAGRNVFSRITNKRFDQKGNQSKDSDPLATSALIVKERESNLTSLNTTEKVSTPEIERSEQKTTNYTNLAISGKTSVMRSGASSRQRVEPMNIPLVHDDHIGFEATVLQSNDALRKTRVSNKDSSNVYFGSAAITITSGPQNVLSKKVPSPNNDSLRTSERKNHAMDVLHSSPKQFSRMQISYSVSPPKTIWPEIYKTKETSKSSYIPLSTTNQHRYEEFKPEDRQSENIIDSNPYLQKTRVIDHSECEKPLKSDERVAKSRSFKLRTDPSVLPTDEPSHPIRKFDIWESEKESNDHLVVSNAVMAVEEQDGNSSETEVQFPKHIALTAFTSGIYTNKISSSSKNSMSQIEDNIDNIIRAPRSEIMRESYAMDDTINIDHNIAEEKKKSNDDSSNVSESSKRKEIQSSVSCNTSAELPSEQCTSKTIGVDEAIQTFAQIRESKNMEKYVTSAIPEFLQIQLNHVDKSPPACNIVLSTSSPVDNNPHQTPAKSPVEVYKVRKFSQDDIEISEISEIDKNSPEGGLDFSDSNESSSDTPRTPKLSILTNNIFRAPLPVSALPPPIPSSTSRHRLSISSSDAKKDVLKRHFSGNDLDKTEFGLTNYFTTTVREKRSSLTESVNSGGLDVVILRKKSLPQIQTKHRDEEPELMKVFARRSLKIKDNETEFLDNCSAPKAIGQPEEIVCNNDTMSDVQSKDNKASPKEIKVAKYFASDIPVLRKSREVDLNSKTKSRDSDKENENDSPQNDRKQSSMQNNTSQTIINRQETLTESNKVSDTTLPGITIIHAECSDEPKPQSEKTFKKHSTETGEVLQAQQTPKVTIEINPSSKNVLHNLGGKLTKSVVPNVLNNNNIETSYTNLKKDKLIIEEPVSTNKDPKSLILESYAKIVWPNTAASKTEIVRPVLRKISYVGDLKKNNASSKKSNERHTIGGTDVTPEKSREGVPEPEFKGILQRRAEWERRAQQAMK